MKLVVSREAATDLDRLRDFLASGDATAARRAISTLIRAIDSLAVFPDRGVPSAISDVRELVVPFGRSAYIVRFAHIAARDEVIVLRVWHGRETRR